MEKQRFKSLEGCKEGQSYLIDQRRKTFEKLNFCNIKDLPRKLFTSKAASTTVQDVHLYIARGG